MNGIGQLLNDAVEQQPVKRQPGIQYFLGEGVALGLPGRLADFEIERCDDLAQPFLVIVLHAFENVPDGLEHPVHAERPVVLAARLLRELLGFGVVVVVAPEVLLDLVRLPAQLFGDEGREAFDGEAPVVEGARKHYVFLFGGEVEVRFERVDGLLSLFAAAVGSYSFSLALLAHLLRDEGPQDRVHVLDHLVEMVVGLQWLHLAVRDQLVHFVQHQNRRQLLGVQLLQHPEGLARHALHSVHHQQRGVGEPQRRRYLRVKLEMSWRVDEVDEMVLVEEGDRGGLHCDPAVLLVEPIVEQLQLPGLLAVDDPIGCNEAVREGRLAVVDVRHDGHIANVAGIGQERADLLVACLLADHDDYIL